MKIPGQETNDIFFGFPLFHQFFHYELTKEVAAASDLKHSKSIIYNNIKIILISSHGMNILNYKNFPLNFG